MTETLRAYVNAWECDENAHLNVQFYFRHFEDAAAQFFAQAGIPVDSCPRPQTRHVRYHRELRLDEAVVCHSHGVAGAPGQLVHVLRETASGDIAATALDSYAPATDGLAEALAADAAPLPEAAAPRGVPPGPAASVDGGADAFAGGFATFRGRLRPGQCDPRGVPYDTAIIAMASDGAAQLWTGIGVTPAWLAEHGAGRVAVEMKLTRGAAGGIDRPVHLVSRLTGVGNSTVTFEHLVVDTASGAAVAAVQAAALTMDLTKRRALRFTDAMRAALTARIGAGRDAEAR